MNKYAATRKAYYEANKEKIDAVNKAYSLANKEKVAAKNKAWYLKNKEKEAIKNKAYYEANKEKASANMKAYYEANKEKASANMKAWAINNKNKIAAICAKRRALKLNAEATMTKAEKENYANLVKIRDDATKLFGYKWSIEHIIPLSKNGTNAIDNLEVTPLSWNIAKNNRSSESFWG